jgi:hypothetical protein
MGRRPARSGITRCAAGRGFLLWRINMLHRARTWTIATVNSAESLAEILTQHTWCCCNGFRLEDYLFVNDATCADGAQEYAVLKQCGERYQQIESLTFSWMTQEQALDIIRQALAGRYDHDSYDFVGLCRLQTPAEHGRCQHYA